MHDLDVLERMWVPSVRALTHAHGRTSTQATTRHRILPIRSLSHAFTHTDTQKPNSTKPSGHLPEQLERYVAHAKSAGISHTTKHILLSL